MSWTNLERGIDGWIGRMMSWMNHAPVDDSRFSDSALRESSLPAHDGETMSREQVSEEHLSEELPSEELPSEDLASEELVSEETAPSGTTAARPSSPLAADPITDDGAFVAPTSADDRRDELTEAILAALEARGGAASAKELQGETGATPQTVRRRLRQLIADGRVQRRGKGMRTRYHLVES